MKNLKSSKGLVCLKRTFSVLLLLISFNTQAAIFADTIFKGVTTTTVDSTEAGDVNPFWQVKFKVDTTGTNDNATGGWIIQKVTMSEKSYLCPVEDGAEPYYETTIRYYEVWAVAPGKDTTSPEFPNGANDRFSLDVASKPEGTYGTITITGELAFVTNPGGGPPATPGSAGGPDTNRTDAGGSTWAPGGVPFAGGLISTIKKPSFWDKLSDSGKILERSWSESWNKCKDKEEEEEEVEEVEEGGGDDGDGGLRPLIPFSSGFEIDKMSFYPNPAKTELNTFGSENIKTIIYGISGVVMLESSERQINIQGLPPGTYFIHLSNGTAITNDILIIQ